MLRRTNLRAFRRLTPNALALVALLALPALSACAGDPVAPGPGSGPGGGGEWARSPFGGVRPDSTGGSDAQSSRLVGRWWRSLAFTSEGSSRLTETYWDFHADGTAERRLVTANLTHGLSDILVWTGRWRVVGGELQITYLIPAQGTVRFRWRVERFIDGEALFLDDTRFMRLP